VSGPQAVVVTGASSGIGEACVAALSACGYTVFAGVRTAADAARIERPPGIRAITLDVTNPSEIAAAARSVADSGHALHALVNNAGIAVAGPLECLPLDELRRQLEVNVIGALAVTQAFLPLLREALGRIVFVGSISGRLAVPYIAPYSASKAALRSIAAALRAELIPAGVRVVLVEPGSVRTPIWRKGREAADGLRRLLGPSGVEAYGAVIDALVRKTHAEERSGISAERVAEAVVRGIRAARPRREELVGFSARAGGVVALLPAPIRDRLMLYSMRLPTHR